MGATAVNTPGGEIMPALQAGVVDTAEWVGPWNDLAFGFYKVAKHYYGPGFHEGSTCGELMIDLNAWNKLPKDLQNIAFGASLTTNSRMPSEYFAKNAGSLPVLLNEHNVQPHSFSDDVLRTMYSLSEDLVAETASEGEVNRRAHDNWSQFRHTSTEYQPLSDLGFTRNRALTLGT